MYHDVYKSDANESGFLRERDLPYKIQLDVFEEQVKSLRDYCENNNLLRDTIVFTFDDGGKSFYMLVAPVLEKYGFKGLFFISTQYINTETFLNKDEIIELHKRGHIIGSHAHSHEHLYTLTDSQVIAEWRTSVEILSEIVGEPVRYASIPNGDTSKRVLDAVYNSGIRTIYTSEPTTKVNYYKDMRIIGRYVVLSEDSTQHVLSIVSSKKTRLILSCKRAVLRVIKTILGDNYVSLKNKLYRK